MNIQIKNSIASILVFFGVMFAQAQQKDSASKCRYVKTATGYLMVLREGDNVIESIEKLVKEEKIPCGNFTGIGFAQEVTFGFYDFNLKKFNPKTFNKVEMGSITGSYSMEWGKTITTHSWGRNRRPV